MYRKLPCTFEGMSNDWLFCSIIDKLSLSRLFDLDHVSKTSLLPCPLNNRILTIKHLFLL
jgi:hypothetical protein